MINCKGGLKVKSAPVKNPGEYEAQNHNNGALQGLGREETKVVDEREILGSQRDLFERTRWF